MRAPQSDLPDIAADTLERLRERRPRVHCITNAVAQNFTANVLLAAGPIPSMTISPDEVAAFAASADAVLVNLGTFDADRRAASETAIAQIRAASRPWVLDPVLIDRSPPRADFARKLAFAGAGCDPIERGGVQYARGNRAPRGNTQPRTALSLRLRARPISSPTASVSSGSPTAIRLMARVTVMGCAETALVAAALTVEPDPLECCCICDPVVRYCR